MATLEIYGIPIDVESAEATIAHIGDVGRVFSGAAVSAPRTLRQWTVTTAPQTPETAEAIRALVNGDGQWFDFTNATISTGVTPYSSKGAAAQSWTVPNAILADTLEPGNFAFSLSGTSFQGRKTNGALWPIGDQNYTLTIKMRQLKTDGTAEYAVYSYLPGGWRYKNGAFDPTDPLEFRRVSYFNTVVGQTNFGTGHGNPPTRGESVTINTRRRFTGSDGIERTMLAMNTGTTHVTTAPTWPLGYNQTVVDGSVTFKVTNFAYFYIKWIWWFPVPMPASWLASLNTASWPIPSTYPALTLTGDMVGSTTTYAIGSVASTEIIQTSTSRTERITFTLREL
jgi:hypothetical protein